MITDVEKVDAFTEKLTKLSYEFGIILTIQKIELFDPADDIGDQVERYVSFPNIARDVVGDWKFDSDMSEIAWSGKE